MVLRQQLSSNSAKVTGGLLTKKRTGDVNIPLPKSLQKYNDPASSAQYRDSSRLPSSVNRTSQSRVFAKERIFTKDGADRHPIAHYDPAEKKQITASDPSVERYLDEKVAETHGIVTKAESSEAGQLFGSMPAYLSREYMDPNVIFRLWPMLTQLLPPDPMNSHVTGTTGVRSLQSWAPLRNPDDRAKNRLHLGWTLPMFPTAIDPISLLPDGTDTRFLPGPPEIWPYRLWLSGSIKQGNLHPPRITFNTLYNHIVEKPIRAEIVGNAVKVTVRKLISNSLGKRLGGAYTGPSLLKIIGREPSEDLNDYTGPFACEEYTLGFFREPPASLAGTGDTSIFKKIETAPDHVHKLSINRHHLFTWSGVTQNAHLIHLDPKFAQDVYSAKALVVQGSLLVFLITEWLRRVLTAKAVRRLDRFELISVHYKILLPTFVDESITFCAKRTSRPEVASIAPEFKVWIERPSTIHPEEKIRTFTGIIRVQTQKWDGRDRLAADREEDLPGMDEDSIATASPDSQFSANGENRQGYDELDSDGFSSPFFKQ